MYIYIYVYVVTYNNYMLDYMKCYDTKGSTYDVGTNIS